MNHKFRRLHYGEKVISGDYFIHKYKNSEDFNNFGETCYSSIGIIVGSNENEDKDLIFGRIIQENISDTTIKKNSGIKRFNLRV